MRALDVAKKHKATVGELRSHQHFLAWLEDALTCRPTIPTWNSKNDNTADMHRASAMQEGFDLALTCLGVHNGRRDDNG